MSNNICEHVIRSFTIGRKKLAVLGLTEGSHGQRRYSVVETCKANDIDPFKYLVYLFERMPNMNIKIYPDELDELLPWNEEVQKNCK